ALVRPHPELTRHLRRVFAWRAEIRFRCLSGFGDVGLDLREHIADPLAGDLVQPQGQRELVAVLLVQDHHAYTPRSTRLMALLAKAVHFGPCSPSTVLPSSV